MRDDNNVPGNVVVGQYSLYSNTTGSDNVAVGHRAGAGITSGHHNIILGDYAGLLLEGEACYQFILNVKDGNFQTTITSEEHHHIKSVLARCIHSFI